MLVFALKDVLTADLSVPAKRLARICPPAAGPVLLSEVGRVSHSGEGLVVYS